jgi:hypothetical protein
VPAGRAPGWSGCISERSITPILADHHRRGNARLAVRLLDQETASHADQCFGGGQLPRGGHDRRLTGRCVCA